MSDLINHSKCSKNCQIVRRDGKNKKSFLSSLSYLNPLGYLKEKLISHISTQEGFTRASYAQAKLSDVDSYIAKAYPAL
ncbi:hypothetical protein A2160_05925 [Candidatus Beckwithbacteria bacterium RBG_13_42_9]|uniref:Uncharacterized protein n=1 Tax=Candidatus Beckwithbacteria bacterium RBG_13_42_9 TaxID=1797457 RepID=A0A1F5E5A9_9BACT|nr:MAG: hypothetical protein A2160_05925 [Candidatus Beckwithbacteria bacterium RBG_13_42_9]